MTTPEFKTPAARAAGVDCYALFDLDERFHIDVDELDRRYLERSKVVHPDRFVNAAASERVAALQASMQLNDAYKVLRRPVLRAEYLLGRHGLTIGTNERLEPAFLMEVLELREDLAEAKLSGDKKKLRALEQDMLDRRDAAMATIGALFVRLEAARSGAGSAQSAAEILAEIKTQLIVLRYIHRYLDEFDELFDEDGEL